MALYWKDEKVALDIVDDELVQHIEEGELPSDWKVIRVTKEQVSSLDGSRQVGDTLRAMLGMEPIEKTPEWLEENERLFYSLQGIFNDGLASL